jgi:hypothetical protein
MIFKRASCENELFEGMQKAEDYATVIDESHTDSLVYDVLQNLNVAAETFETLGLTKEATKITEVMISLAEKNKSKAKKNKKSKPKTKEEKDIFKFFGFGPGDLNEAKSSS